MLLDSDFAFEQFFIIYIIYLNLDIFFVNVLTQSFLGKILESGVE